jgi:uncharacterized protein YraI
MRKPIVSSLCAGAAALLILPAASSGQSAGAFTNSPVNLYAGPSQEYPVVAQLQGNVPVQVMGCVSGYSWCDVEVSNLRGWVYGAYLSYPYQGSSVPVMTYGPTIGFPIVTFAIGTYWGRYYRNRPWYHDEPRWEHRPPPSASPHGRPPGPPPPHGGPPPGHEGRPPASPPAHGGPPPGHGGPPPSHGGPPPEPVNNARQPPGQQPVHGGPPPRPVNNARQPPGQQPAQGGGRPAGPPPGQGGGGHPAGPPPSHGGGGGGGGGGHSGPPSSGGGNGGNGGNGPPPQH